MKGREVLRQMTNDKQTPQHKLGNRTDGEKCRQTLAAQVSKKQFKQQRQQRRLKKTYCSTYETRENFDLFRLSTLSEISQTECKTASNFGKEILKVVLVQFTVSRT